jgi:hypothetical protein
MNDQDNPNGQGNCACRHEQNQFDQDPLKGKVSDRHIFELATARGNLSLPGDGTQKRPLTMVASRKRTGHGRGRSSEERKVDRFGIAARMEAGTRARKRSAFEHILTIVSRFITKSHDQFE